MVVKKERIDVENELGNQIINAAVYIYFLAFAAGMGLLTASVIGYKLYKRMIRKEQQPKQVKRGVRA